MNIKYKKPELMGLLQEINVGSSVAEHDNMLEAARIETSAFSELYHDRVDLVPGTKGSGKSALYRIFVDFLPEALLNRRRVVVAHGVQSHGDKVFHAYKERFAELTEADFVDFWCIYFVSLASEHFVNDSKYAALLKNRKHIETFRSACVAARIPEIKARKSLREVLEWVLNALPRPNPKMTVENVTGNLQFTLFEDLSFKAAKQEGSDEHLQPKYIHQVKEALHEILEANDLYLWLMVDRLDEIFPRRSTIETLALRGLLRTFQEFQTDRIRVKVFLRDDILSQITEGGFTALTHVVSRRANRLEWSEDQILTLMVRRIFASDYVCNFFGVNKKTLEQSFDYRKDCFYKIFPKTVYGGPKQSDTHRWIFTHTMDGKGVVTPRDVIDLLKYAIGRQQDDFRADQAGDVDWVIGPSAIRYGYSEVSKYKSETYLQAEFPHFWEHIEKLRNGRTEYTEQALKRIFGSKYKAIIEDLVSLGMFRESRSDGALTYKVPFLYRQGLELTMGKQDC